MSALTERERAARSIRSDVTPRSVSARSVRLKAASQISTSYLGFPLLVSDQSVTVRTPDGRRLGTEVSMAKARLLVRGYRKASKEGTA